MFLKVLVIICSLVLALGQTPVIPCSFCTDGSVNNIPYVGPMHDSTEGGAAGGDYCLRIDGWPSGGTNTFSCDTNGAGVTWSTDGAGTFQASGSIWHYQGSQLYPIQATYTNLQCCNLGAPQDFNSGDGVLNDLCLTEITGHLTVNNTVFTAELDGSEHSLYIGDGFRSDAGNYTVTGWFNQNGTAPGAQDWVGVLECHLAEEPCPEECGCGYTIGYWKNHCDKNSVFGGFCNKKSEPWPQIGNFNGKSEDIKLNAFLSSYGAIGCTIDTRLLKVINPGQIYPDPQATILVKQLIGVVLNLEKENPACSFLVGDLIVEAAQLLCTAENGLTQQQKARASEINDLFSAFNQGDLADECGPEHCDGAVVPEECPTPPCELCSEESEIVPHGGQLLDHRNGNAQAPLYCLRLDRDGNVYTYSCVLDEAEAYWQIYADGTLRVWGTVYGGKDVGDEYFEPKLCSISAEYSEAFVCCASPEDDGGETGGANDLCSSGSTSGTLSIQCDGESIVTWYSKPRYDDINTVIGDHHRTAGDIFSLFGWLTRPNATGTHDWLAELTCQAQECPPGPGTPPDTDCGCGRTIGYWGSPRFIDPKDDNITINARPINPNSVHDTCKWPHIDALDSRVQIACGDENGNGFCDENDIGCFTWWDILNNNYNSELFCPGKGKNKQCAFSHEWYNMARQLIAAKLNVATGYCGDVCSYPLRLDVEEECPHLLSLIDLSADDLLGGICPAASSTEKYLCTVGADCVYLCDLPQLSEEEECKLAEIFDLANNGDLGPDHCEEESNRGCCVGRPSYPSCDHDSKCHFDDNCNAEFGLQGAHAVDLQGGQHHNNNDDPHWWDISNLVMNILILIIIIALIIWGCSRKGGIMPSNSSLEDVLKNR